MSRFTVKWKNEAVGEFISTSFDMGYFEGEFVSNKTNHAQKFIEHTRKLDSKLTLRDFTKAMRAIMITDDGSEFYAIVLSLDKSMNLWFKSVTGRTDTIEWVLQNVPEV